MIDVILQLLNALSPIVVNSLLDIASIFVPM